MKSLLLLSLIGAAIYAALLLANPLPDSNSDTVAVQPQAGQLSSWASDLGSLKPQIASVKRPPTPFYERKPRQVLPYVDEANAAGSTPQAEPAVASPKPKTANVASRKVKPQVRPVEISDRVAVTKSGYKRTRWSRRAERRARKAFGRAFLLGN